MKKAVPFCVILVCLLVTKPVTASNWQKKWPDNEVTFHGHLEDFEHLRGVNLTQDQAKWWIAYSMQTWVSRTSADFQFGWETKNSVSSSECTDDDSDGEFESDGDSVSEISAPPGGKIPNQKNVAAYARGRWVNGEFTEMDICIYRDATKWAVKSSKFPNQKLTDLVAVLTHELGHAIGSVGVKNVHRNHTVLDPGVGDGTTRGRYPFGKDVEGIHKLYGWVERQRGWKKWDWNTSSWKDRHNFPGSNAIFYTTGDTGYTASRSRWEVMSTSMTTEKKKELRWFRQCKNHFT